MIFLTSRYVDGPLDTLPDPRTGQYKRTVFRKAPRPSTGYVSYLWRERDRIDLVAKAFYDDSTAWWQIMDANPDIIDPTAILPGTLVRLPR
jgi:nucleoid-associated protein YgaU